MRAPRNGRQFRDRRKIRDAAFSNGASGARVAKQRAHDTKLFRRTAALRDRILQCAERDDFGRVRGRGPRRRGKPAFNRRDASVHRFERGGVSRLCLLAELAEIESEFSMPSTRAASGARSTGCGAGRLSTAASRFSCSATIFRS